jgi:hypothetical protein
MGVCALVCVILRKLSRFHDPLGYTIIPVMVYMAW